jgi:prefoldin beta subunit
MYYYQKTHRRKNMTDVEMSKQLQDQINRLQQMRMQLQMLMQQRQQVELRLKETQEAITEIQNTDDKTAIYKSIGALLIKTKGKTDVLKELKENEESLELRKNTLEKQEGRTKEKVNELQSKIQNSLNVSQDSEES